MEQYNDEEYDIEGDESMLLDEEMDDNYEPTDEEIVEYAQFLGMNLREDQDLLYIAKEGLKAPLPENYKPYKRRTGDIVYVNLKTNEFQEEHPCDEYYRNLYQETKRKKSQKQTTGSKFKKNFPIAGNSPVSIKADPLPTVNLALNQKKNIPKGFANLDKSNISDQQESIISNNHDTSFSGAPTPLINRENKKKPAAAAANNGFSDSKGFSEQYETDPANGIEALDLEYGQKFLNYSQNREDEIASLRKEYLLQKEKTENKLRKEVEKAMEQLEEDLNEDLRDKTELMTREKEKLKVTLKKQYDDKIEEEIKKLDKAHFNNKKNIHKEQEDTVQNSVANEEISIEQEYKNKKQQLQNQKKDLEIKLHQSKKDDNDKKHKIHLEFDQEKETIIANFKRNLKEFSTTERENQNTEMESYKAHLDEKLKEERDMLVHARQQKQTLFVQRKEELKGMYERKYQLQIENIDNENVENLREYEEKVKLQKDSEIQKIKNQEARQNKDKKQAQLQNEISQLQDNYKKRLYNYEQVLREKYEKETNLLDNEVETMLERTKQEVENISLNVSTKKDLLKEVEQVQRQEASAIVETKELEKKVLKQRDQNIEYQEKLGQMKENYKDIQRTSKQMIEDLKNEIQNTEKQIQNWRSTPKVRLSSPPDAKDAKKKIHAKIPHNLTLSKIMKELQEIKSFMTTKEDKSYLHDLNSRAPSKTLLGSNLFEKPTRSEFSRAQDTDSKYQDEHGHVHQSKQKLKTDKLTLKRVQEHLLEEQRRFRQEFDNFKMSENKSPQKKNNLLAKKEYLNEQVKTLNKDIHALQEREEFLKNREKALGKLKPTTTPGKHEKHNSVASNTLKEYQSLAYEDLHPSKQKERAQTTKGESEFYKRWDKVVENQMSLDVASESENNDVSNNTKQDFHQISKEFFSQKIDRSPSPVKTGFAYDYQNRIKMLDLKLRSGLTGSENDYARKQRNQSTEFRYKMSAVCTQQSQYLNNIKTQLNSQLYDRPQTSVSITASRFL